MADIKLLSKSGVTIKSCSIAKVDCLPISNARYLFYDCLAFSERNNPTPNLSVELIISIKCDIKKSSTNNYIKG